MPEVFSIEVLWMKRRWVASRRMENILGMLTLQIPYAWGIFIWYRLYFKDRVANLWMKGRWVPSRRMENINIFSWYQQYFKDRVLPYRWKEDGLLPEGWKGNIDHSINCCLNSGTLATWGMDRIQVCSNRHSPLKLRSRVAALRGHTDMMADKRGHKDA